MSVAAEGTIEVVILDPSPRFREALLALLADREDMVPVAEVGTAREAVDALSDARGPVVVVTELLLPGVGGLDALRLVRLWRDEATCLVVTELPPAPFAVLAADAGADGFLRKASDGGKFVKAIRLAVGGVRCFSPAAAEVLARDGTRVRTAARRRAAALALRDQVVLSLAAQGMGSDAVAGLLGMGEAEVRLRRGTLIGELGLDDAAALTRFALRAGLVHARLVRGAGSPLRRRLAMAWRPARGRGGEGLGPRAPGGGGAWEA